MSEQSKCEAVCPKCGSPEKRGYVKSYRCGSRHYYRGNSTKLSFWESQQCLRNQLSAALAAKQQAERERDELREALKIAKKEILDIADNAKSRDVINAPEDLAIRCICEQFGYGAVMDSAMRQWRKKLKNEYNVDGAHTTAPAECVLRGTVEKIEKALLAQAESEGK